MAAAVPAAVAGKCFISKNDCYRFASSYSSSLFHHFS